MSLEVKPVTGRTGRKLFYRLPERLYGDAPCFVPALDKTFFDLLNRKKNPFWKQAVGQEWLCWRGDELVGRIGACRDEALFERHPGMGAIGFFESVDDKDVAGALFDTAEAWLRDKGCTSARAPLNYSIQHTGAVLVEGFDTPPCIDTTWNPPYYGALWDAHGWTGAKDLFAMGGHLEYMGPERGRRFAKRVERRGVKIRRLDLSRFQEEVEQGRQVYNEAWDDNWGHVPIGKEEFAWRAKDMRAVFDPALVKIAEAEGKPVGFLFAMPDLNEAIKRCKGRLLPFGWWHLLRAKKVCDRLRTYVLGVVPGYRKRGIEAALLIAAYTDKGERYTWHEASWLLEDNDAIINAMKIYGVEIYKRWRIYEKNLAGA